MKPFRLSGLLVLVMSSPLISIADSSVGLFGDHGDIGGPAIAGSTTYDAGLQQYRMTAGGSNIWGKSDQFQYAWNKLKGDFILRARVEFVGQAGDHHRKMGWMVRSTLDPDSTYVDIAVHGNGHADLQYRATKGAETKELFLKTLGGDVIQLERRGHTYIVSTARFGETFESASFEAELGDEVNAGVFLCAHSPTGQVEAVVRDVRIVIPPKAGYVPYRDYIGAELQVLNVFTGRLEVVYRSAEQFEAPNWMSDERTLIVNVSGPGPNRGRLMTFNLDTKQTALLDTGNAGRNNNDHVLSFDGTMLGASIHTQSDGGRSVVYKLPAGGGTPVRITKNSPSYLHGWSPDGKWLVFTGGRRLQPGDKTDKYDIYKISSDGGDEVRLTDSPGLSDGPEFSPDGKYIYFCSTRTGLMQLYRMKPDGSEQVQLTNDGFNNWFAHVSPDNKWIVFISFGPDVAADNHPYYQQVYVRIKPVEGGRPRVIAYLFGGQGTINVPSWSPDCAHLAFVSNTRMD